MSYETNRVPFQEPLRNDYDQHYDTGRQARFIPTYEISPSGEIQIEDPVWGSETIGNWEGDEIFAQLYRHPVFRRLAAIEQLTLPKVYSTMPGSTEFTRWEHAWGSVVFVRKMIREAEEGGRQFTDREKLVLQLRTLVSDAAHTAFSHLGDWLRQGYGGTEDSHDIDLMQYLEEAGISTILRKSRFKLAPEEVVFPPVEDWVECSSPDLCVDRVDYGVREILRWVDPLSAAVWRDAFALDDTNQLVMKNQALAKYFGVCFGLLATEHWSHPVHRLQLQLFGEVVKGAILSDPPMLRGQDMHPIDRLYTVDPDIIANIRSYGTLNHDLHAVLLDVARAQRRVFAWAREKSLVSFLERMRPDLPADLTLDVDGEPTFPHPLAVDSHWLEYTGAIPQSLELFPVERPADLAEYGLGLDFFLPAFKPRAINPPFIAADGQTCRLTDPGMDPGYALLLKDIRAIQRQPYVARIHLAPAAAAALKKKLQVVREEWEAEMSRERTPESRAALQETLPTLGFLAISSSPNPIREAY